MGIVSDVFNSEDMFNFVVVSAPKFTFLYKILTALTRNLCTVCNLSEKIYCRVIINQYQDQQTAYQYEECI